MSLSDQITISYYEDMFEEILEKFRKYENDDIMPLLKELEEFAKNLKYYVEQDICHEEFMREEEEL
jgi:hypothetical protein